MAESAADFSSYGKLIFRGPDRVKVLQGLLTNDVAGLEPGGVQRNCVLTPKGRLVGDLFLYNRGEDFLGLCRPEYTSSIAAALGKILPLSKTTLEDASARLPASYLQGAGAEGLPYPLFRPDGVVALRPMSEFPGAAALDAEALEVLRVEAGVPLLGVDFDAEAYPLELGLEGAISFTKGCYMGQETVAHMKNRGHVNRRLTGLKISRRPPPGSPVLAEGKHVGKVTSVVSSPRLGCFLGLALIAADAGGLSVGGLPAEPVPLPLAG